MYKMKYINTHLKNLYNLNDKSVNCINFNCIDNNINYYINL